MEGCAALPYVDTHSAKYPLASFVIVAMAIFVNNLALASQSIPEAQIDDQKIYWGSPVSFDTPGEVDLDTVLEATSEYKEIRRENVRRDTARYWILMGSATDRAIRAVATVAEESGYDLVAKKGYLGSLNPSIASDDITKLVIEKL